MPSHASHDPRPTQALYRTVALMLVMGFVPTFFAFALIWTLEAQTWIPWGVLAVGLIFTLFAAAYTAQRQRAQQALQASEQRFRALIEQAADAVALVAADGVIRYQSPGVTRILGFTPDELAGRNAFELLHPEDAEVGTALFGQLVQQSAATRTAQVRYRHKDGSWRWVEATGTNLLSDPAVAAIVVNYRDITGSKEAEAQLRARVRQQAAVAEFGLHALAHTDLEALMGRAVVVVARTLEVEYSYVMELLPEGQALLMRAGVGWKPGLVGHATVSAGIDSQPGYALLSPAPVIVEDLHAETRFSAPALLSDHGVVSGIVITVQGRGRPFGVLGAHARQRRAFNQDDVNFLQAMANVLGEASARTQAEAELDAYVRELGLRDELTRAALASPDFRSILLAITVWLNELFHADGYYLTQWDEDSQTVKPTATSGEAGEGYAVLRLKKGEATLTEAVLRAGRALAVEDVLNTTLISRRIVNSLPARSVLGLPLFAGSQRLGALVIGFNQPHRFAPEEIARGERVASHLALAITQAQLLHAMRRQAEELAVVFRVSQALRAATTRVEMLPIILDHLRAVLPAEGVAFARRDLGNNDLVIEMGRGAWENLGGERIPPAPGQGLSGLAPDTGQPYVIDDIGLDSRLAWTEHQGDLTAAACVPLVAQQEMLGVIWAGRKEPFSRESVGLLTAVADIAANAFHRLQLHEETEHHVKQLAAVSASGRALAELLDPPQIYERLAAAILELLPDVVGVFISLYEREQQVITCVYGVQDGVPLNAEELPPIRLLPPGEATPSQVIHSRRPLIVGELPAKLKEAAANVQAGMVGLVTQSALYVPMLTRGEVLGVVQVQSHLPHRFRERDAEILGIIANMAAVTLQNARLFQELQASNADLARRVEERTADLSTANAELARAARLKDEFLASMSHELRTPLNGILVLTESLLEQLRGLLNERHVKSLRSIEASGRHLLSLINDILDLSKIEAGKLDLQMDTVLVEEICQASLLFVKEVANKKRLGLAFRLDDPQAKLSADPRRLKQILVNLLSNAVKFTPEGGQVSLEVTTDAEGNVIHFVVHDTGVGIAPDDLARLFQPFAQLDSRLSRQHEGTGLGLALVRRLAEMHGGGVSLESEVGKGSRFTVSLPCRDLPGPATAGGLPTASARRALVVEDSPTAAEQIARYVQELGIQATIHLQGEGVVDQVLKVRPDVIFLDLLMPDRSGWEVLAQLKADPATQAIPVIIVSVVDEPAKGLEGGAAEYLVKPVSREQIRQALGRVPTPANGVHEALVVALDAPVAPPPAPKTAGAMILLAEDNEINIQAIGDYLQDNGYHVVVARNGGEALERAREKKPDLILMDIQMPEMDGLEATRRLRAEAALAATPIIALTALAMPGDRERCLAAGANDYLTKPVSVKGLVQTIEKLLKR